MKLGKTAITPVIAVRQSLTGRQSGAAIGEAVRSAPDAALVVTADHGMNPKTRCVDIARLCAAHGRPIRFAVSPVADRLTAHHGGHGGVSYVYLEHPDDADEIASLLRSDPGVEAIWERAAAAELFHLPADCLGDLVVAADRDTVFGALDAVDRALAADYRNHGSLHEAEIPLIAHNLPGASKNRREARYNFDLTASLY